MTLILILVSLVVFCPFTYAIGRVHGINQATGALDRYHKAVTGEEPKKIESKKTKSEKPKNIHYECGDPWEKWSDCSVNIVNSAGVKTGAVVRGQLRYCSGCGQKDVRTDI